MKRDDRPIDFQESKDQPSEREIVELFSKLKNFNLKKQSKFKFFCPLCASERRIPYFPNPTIKNYLQVGIFSLVIFIFFFPVFDYKGVFIAFPIFAVYEMIYRFKKRHDSVCPYCGFDFFLYKSDVAQAKAKVKAFWDKKLAEKAQKDSNNQKLISEQENLKKAS